MLRILRFFRRSLSAFCDNGDAVFSGSPIPHLEEISELCRHSELAEKDWERLSRLCLGAKEAAARLRGLSGSDDIRLKYCES